MLESIFKSTEASSYLFLHTLSVSYSLSILYQDKIRTDIFSAMAQKWVAFCHGQLVSHYVQSLPAPATPTHISAKNSHSPLQPNRRRLFCRRLLCTTTRGPSFFQGSLLPARSSSIVSGSFSSPWPKCSFLFLLAFFLPLCLTLLTFSLSVCPSFQCARLTSQSISHFTPEQNGMLSSFDLHICERTYVNPFDRLGMYNTKI